MANGEWLGVRGWVRVRVRVRVGGGTSKDFMLVASHSRRMHCAYLLRGRA